MDPFSSGIEDLGVVSSEEQRGLYWVAVSLQFPIDEHGVILPRRWVAQSRLYNEVSADLSPQSISVLEARRTEFDDAPTLEKCVSEAVFEQVRQRVLPEAPSRLSCLFAAPNLVTAMEIWGEYLPAPRLDVEGMGLGGAIPVSTADGRWVAVDLRLFESRPISADPAAVHRSLQELDQLAEDYWYGNTSPAPVVEVLTEKLWEWTAYAREGAPTYAEFRESRRQSAAE